MQPNKPSTSRVQKYRAKLRKAGLKPVQIWAPDTKSEHFIAECRRQSQLVALSDQYDTSLSELMNEAVKEVDGWE